MINDILNKIIQYPIPVWIGLIFISVVSIGLYLIESKFKKDIENIHYDVKILAPRDYKFDIKFIENGEVNTFTIHRASKPHVLGQFLYIVDHTTQKEHFFLIKNIISYCQKVI